MREVVFDTETTGLSPTTGDRLVEIGCIEMINRVETGRNFHCYFNPERSMPIEAQNVHGLSEAFLADKALFADKVEELIDFLDDSPLVAHNASFDFSFINHELRACGRLTISNSRMIDTLALARIKHPGAKHSLDALCVRYGIDRSHRIKHGALLDAELLSQVYVELTGGRQIGLELQPTIQKAQTDAPALMAFSTVGQKTLRQPRPHSVSPAEIERHKLFVDKLDSPLWNEDIEPVLVEKVST